MQSPCFCSFLIDPCCLLEEVVEPNPRSVCFFSVLSGFYISSLCLSVCLSALSLSLLHYPISVCSLFLFVRSNQGLYKEGKLTYLAMPLRLTLCLFYSRNKKNPTCFFWTLVFYWVEVMPGFLSKHIGKYFIYVLVKNSFHGDYFNQKGRSDEDPWPTLL